MTKQYQALLPLSTDDTVKNQFGWLPVSVYHPGKGIAWDKYFTDDGDPAGTRRSEDAKYLPGLRFSRFNPELAETVIRYWSMEGDLVIDPFAGRSTRGVVATVLGRQYVGYEVVSQVAQKARSDISLATPCARAEIHVADGCLMAHSCDDTAKLIFTCPPYHRLERYEAAQWQLSDLKSYEAFLGRIQQCANNIWRVMALGAFLCWVCADWRDGVAFRLFHKDSLDIFSGVGLTVHDIVIIHNNSPFAPLQAGKVAAKRYTAKTHEYLLVFRKDNR